MNLIILLVLGLLTIEKTYPKEKTNAKISIQITGLRNNQGVIRCALFNSEDGFPDKPEKALQKQTIEPSNKEAECVFETAYGQYAISVFHDEDKSGQIKKNFLSIPTSGFGFSQNPSYFMGPPSFYQTLTMIHEPKAKILIQMRYL